MPEKKKTAVKDKSPTGWFMSGLNPDMYEASIDTTAPHSGTKCAHVRMASDQKSDKSTWSTLMQMFRAKRYLEKRIRMSFWVKTKDADWAAPWMRVDGQKSGDTLSFDNMCNRQIKGTTEWSEHSIVLDVPEESTFIAFGVMLGGTGDLWIDDVSFEVVGDDVPLTKCPCSKNPSGPSGPKNLNFEEG